jgi:acetyl esterase/lipase
MNTKIIGYLVVFVVIVAIGVGYYFWYKVNMNNIEPTQPPVVNPLPTPPEPEPKEQILTNINYAGTTDVEQNLDLFIPATKNYPVVVFVHGGGWQDGNKETYQYVGRFYQTRGIGCAVINYRLSPRVKFPSHAQDTAKAIAWTYNNIAKHGGDPNKLYLSGHSAGGHLASLVALDDSYLTVEQTSPKIIKGVVSISAPYVINHNVNIGGFGHVFNGFDKAKASPMNFVKAGAPPFIISYADADLPTLPKQAIKFNDALIKAGNKSELFMYKNQDHTSIVISLFQSGPYESEMIKLMKNN